MYKEPLFNKIEPVFGFWGFSPCSVLVLSHYSRVNFYRRFWTFNDFPFFHWLVFFAKKSMSRGGAETDNISCITDAMIHQPLQNEFTIYRKNIMVTN